MPQAWFRLYRQWGALLQAGNVDLISGELWRAGYMHGTCAAQSRGLSVLEQAVLAGGPGLTETTS